MKIKQLLGLLMTCLTLGLLSVIKPVYADDQGVSVTIISPVGQQEVRYQLFKIDDGGQLDTIKNLSKEALEKRYSFVKTRATGEAGKNVAEVGLGTYYVVGISSNTNRLVPTIVPILLDVTDLRQDHIVYTKSHQPTGNVELFKYEWKDGKKVPLAGVVFTLFDQNRQPVRVKQGQATLDADGIYELVTDKDGRITVSGLAEGTYYFREIKALSGYRLPNQEYTVTVKQDSVARIEIENTPTDEGGKRFRKVNEEKKSLHGAVFTVLDSKKNPLFQVTSDKDGYFEVNHLPYGDYFLKETTAPVVDGVTYALLTQEISFTISATSYTDGTVFEIINKPLTSIPPTPDIPKIIKQILPRTGEVGSVLGVVGLLVIGVAFIIKKKSSVNDKD